VCYNTLSAAKITWSGSVSIEYCWNDTVRGKTEVRIRGETCLSATLSRGYE
jgi:hypothetical protein